MAAITSLNEHLFLKSCVHFYIVPKYRVIKNTALVLSTVFFCNFFIWHLNICKQKSSSNLFILLILTRFVVAHVSWWVMAQQLMIKHADTHTHRKRKAKYILSCSTQAITSQNNGVITDLKKASKKAYWEPHSPDYISDIWGKWVS